MENKELMEKARQANSPEELLTLAKENGYALDEEGAKAYFEQLHKTGELSDDELDNVAGGGCYKGDRLVVSALNDCDKWRCKKCGGGLSYDGWYRIDNHLCSDGERYGYTCGDCKYCSYEKGLWLCNHPERMRK